MVVVVVVKSLTQSLRFDYFAADLNAAAAARGGGHLARSLLLSFSLPRFDLDRHRTEKHSQHLSAVSSASVSAGRPIGIGTITEHSYSSPLCVPLDGRVMCDG